METSYNSYNLDHIGLIAGMVDELGLELLIDTLIPQDQQQRHVSVGKCVKAMILNGLGFANRTLYLMPHYFKDKPVERLSGESIKAEYLNDDVFGRALDDIYNVGASNFYAQLAAQSLWMKAMSGNSNDSSDFREIIKTHLSQLEESIGMSIIIADSALYAKETLKELGDFAWITRVPETIGGVSELCQSWQWNGQRLSLSEYAKQ